MHSRVLLPAITGTSAMTVFSYLVSNAKDENYREPLVLEILIKRLIKEGEDDTAAMMAWSLHYFVGILFTYVYASISTAKKVHPSVMSGLCFGAVCGLVGIAGWNITFKLHPDPPKKNLKKYFGHLFVAHLVFGVVTALSLSTLPGANRRSYFSPGDKLYKRI